MVQAQTVASRTRRDEEAEGEQACTATTTMSTKPPPPPPPADEPLMTDEELDRILNSEASLVTREQEVSSNPRLVV